MKNANFSKSRFSNSIFESVNLTNVEFTNAKVVDLKINNSIKTLLEGLEEKDNLLTEQENEDKAQ